MRRVARRAGGGLFVVLLPTLECNLACGYCFESHPRGRWDVAQAERYLGEIFDLAQYLELSRVCLHWQGGEVLLMGVPFLAELLPKAVEVGRSRGVEVEQRLQTNLTLYSHELGQLAHEFTDGRLGTSFEPGGERRFGNGSGGRFVDRWSARLAEAEADGLEVGVLSLVSPTALEMGAAAYLEQLRDRFGIRRLRLTLPFAAPQSSRGFWLDAPAAGRFLVDAYRWWRDAGGDEQMEIRPFGYLERRLSGEHDCRDGLCTFSDNCAESALCIGPGGDVTLCDCHVTASALPPYGNLEQQSLVECFMGPGRGRALQLCDALVGERCLGCRWLSVCHGGCLVRARDLSRSSEDHYCEAYRALLDAVSVACVPQLRARC
jgi:uncharacterized protein